MQACRIGFDIPDDKVPKGKALKILCPRCKAPTEINEKAIPPELDDRVPYLSESLEPEFVVDPLLDYANAIDVVDEGVKTALLCDTNVKRAERIAQALQELDFWVVHALAPCFRPGKAASQQL